MQASQAVTARHRPVNANGVCRAIYCQTYVGMGRLFCDSHWERLPSALRERLAEAYRQDTRMGGIDTRKLWVRAQRAAQQTLALLDAQRRSR